MAPVVPDPADAAAVAKAWSILKPALSWLEVGRGGHYQRILPVVMHIKPTINRLKDNKNYNDDERGELLGVSRSQYIRVYKLCNSRHLQELARNGQLNRGYIDKYLIQYLKNPTKEAVWIAQPQAIALLSTIPPFMNLAPAPQPAAAQLAGADDVEPATLDESLPTKYRLGEGMSIVDVSEVMPFDPGFIVEELVPIVKNNLDKPDEFKDEADREERGMHTKVPGWMEKGKKQWRKNTYNRERLYLLLKKFLRGRSIEGFLYQDMVHVPGMKKHMPHVAAFGVVPAHQGNNYGKALLARAVSDIRLVEKNAIFIGDIRKDNGPSQGAFNRIAELFNLVCEPLGMVEMVEGKDYSQLKWGKPTSADEDYMEWGLVSIDSNVFNEIEAAKDKAAAKAAAEAEAEAEAEEDENEAIVASSTAKAAPTSPKKQPARKPSTAPKAPKAPAAKAAKKGGGGAKSEPVPLGKGRQILKGRVKGQVTNAGGRKGTHKKKGH